MGMEPIELIEPYYDRQPGENTLWFSRFCRYRNQIGRRSVLQCVNAEKAENGAKKRTAKVPGSWDQAKQKFRWNERCEAWDLFKQQIEDEKWDERFNKLREAIWENSELLISKAQPMLKMPIVKQQMIRQDAEGTMITTIEAVDWYQFMPALQMLKLGVLLGEKAIGNLNIAATLLTQAGYMIKDPAAIAELTEITELAQLDAAQESQGINAQKPQQD